MTQEQARLPTLKERREAESKFWLSPVLARVAGSADFAGWYALEPGSPLACSWGEG